MRSINAIIVEAKQTYNNEVELTDGKSLILNSTIESVSHINRIATVVAAPKWASIQKGDQVVVHHNIMRSRNDTKGNTIESNYSIGNKMFIVPPTEIFMYKRDGDWVALDPYCFVQPIPKDDSEEFFALGESEGTHKGMQKKVGIMSYPNKALLEQDVNVGDKVIFKDYSEYEFEIEGKLYYKMATKDIIATV